jgi:hypothetical protein
MLVVGLGGCVIQRASPVITAAGRTYVVFQRLNPTCVHHAITKELVDHDWTIKSTSEAQIVAEQPAPAWINTAVLLASFNPPLVQMTLTLQSSGSDLKVHRTRAADSDDSADESGVRQFGAAYRARLPRPGRLILATGNPRCSSTASPPTQCKS